MSEPPIIGSGSGHSVRLEGGRAIAHSRQARVPLACEAATEEATAPRPPTRSDPRPGDAHSPGRRAARTDLPRATRPAAPEGRLSDGPSPADPGRDVYQLSAAVKARIARLRTANAATRDMIESLPAEDTGHDGPAAQLARTTDTRQEPSDG